MESEKKLAVMRNLYTGLQAETIMRYAKAGIFEEVEKERIELSLTSGGRNAERLAIENAREAFAKPASITDCAFWEIEERDNSLTAVCTGCKLIGMCKQMQTPSPCKMYCLSPIEGMIKALKPGAYFRVVSTLYDGENCTVRVDW